MEFLIIKMSIFGWQDRCFRLLSYYVLHVDIYVGTQNCLMLQIILHTGKKSEKDVMYLLAHRCIQIFPELESIFVEIVLQGQFLVDVQVQVVIDRVWWPCYIQQGVRCGRRVPENEKTT
jgi:hypothetical protein